jgi:hypothetical protein
VYLQWHDGNYTVMVLGNIPLSALLDVAVHTRLATDDEWQAQIDASTSANDTGTYSNEPATVEITQDGSSAETGVVVSAGIELDDSGQRPLQVSRGNGTSFSGIESDPNRPVTVFFDIDRTIIVGVFHAPGPRTKLRVSVPGQASVYVPLVPLGDTGDFGAAYVYSEIGEPTVALVAPDGGLIQELDVTPGPG